MTKNKNYLIVILLITLISITFLLFFKNSSINCLQTNQTSKMTTAEENMIIFDLELINHCDYPIEINKFNLVTKEKLEDTIINDKRIIEQDIVLKNKETKSITIDYLLDEEEFKKFNRYLLVPIIKQ